MGSAVVLTERDEEILLALTHKVRILTPSQVASTWWRGSSRAGTLAARRLSDISKLGLLNSDHVLVRPFLPLEGPELSWKPGEPVPDFEPLAYRLRVRWGGRPFRSTRVYFATRAAVNQFGGYMRGCLDHPNEATHDLHHAELYLRILRDHPGLARGWVSESELSLKSKPFEVLPDSILRDPDGSDRLVIEFAGIYDATRLRRIHDYAESRELPYELW